MNHGTATQTDSGSVTAAITYAIDTGIKPVNETFETGQVIRRRTGATEQRPMRIHDGRPLVGQLSLDQNGFVLVDHETAVADFFDAAQLESIYYPEIERLVQSVSGASRVVVFDHTLRTGDSAEQQARKIREPVAWAHNDYTEWSGPQRVREILPDEAEQLLRHRFAIIRSGGRSTSPSSPTRSRSWTRVASRQATCFPPSAATPTAWARPISCVTTRTTAGSISRACGATRLWCSRSTNRRPTAGRGSRRTPRSSIPPPARTHRRARVSRCGRSRFSRRRDAERSVTRFWRCSDQLHTAVP